jgi:hypothetical protein
MESADYESICTNINNDLVTPKIKITIEIEPIPEEPPSVPVSLFLQFVMKKREENDDKRFTKSVVVCEHDKSDGFRRVHNSNKI